jgi:ribonuclease-3
MAPARIGGAEPEKPEDTLATLKRERLQKAIGYVFKDPDLLARALTHSSWAYEIRPECPEDNELLEFLGDSVIGLVTAEFYLSAFPGRNEGELSKLKASATSTLALSQLARSIKLDKAVLLGRGEEKSGGRKKVSILAGSFEALAGAMYLDGGFEAAKRFICGLLESSLKPIKSESLTINNSKSALQEICQKAGLPAPSYRLVSEKGPAHERTFVVEVHLGEKVLAKSKGPSKKSAEQKAAEKVLKAYLGRKIKRISPEAFVIEAEDLALP